MLVSHEIQIMMVLMKILFGAVILNINMIF
jgi:hypothetical protein